MPLPSKLFGNDTSSTFTSSTTLKMPIQRPSIDIKAIQTPSLMTLHGSSQELSSKMRDMTKKYISAIQKLHANITEGSFLRQHMNKCSDKIKRTHSLSMLPLKIVDSTACISCQSTSTMHITTNNKASKRPSKSSTCSKEVVLFLYRDTRSLPIITWMLKMALSLQLELITLSPDTHQKNQSTVTYINLNELNPNYPLVILASYSSIQFSSVETVTLQRVIFSCQKLKNPKLKLN